jgi:hypothetical protein
VPFFRFGHAGGGQRQHDVFQQGQVRDQMKALENKPQKLPAKIGALFRFETVDIDVVHGQCARGGGVHGTEDGEQGRFSRPRFPHDTDEFSAVDGKG